MTNDKSQIANRKCVMIIAGEASGDLHGAKLVKAMCRRDRSLFFCGIGGQALRDAGVRILTDASELSVVGITEVFSKMSNILKGVSVAKNLLKTLRPDLLILIDFPDFNLHVAATAKRLDIPVLYYISPQIWAWRSGRVKKIGRLVDHMAVILPFEAAFYRKHKIPVTYVGHPLNETGNLKLETRDPHQVSSFKFQVSSFTLGFLPGSRDGEISRLLPVMLETAAILLKKRKNIKFIISLAPSVNREAVEDMIPCPSPLAPRPSPHFSLLRGVDDVFEKCDLVVAASGTVALEAAMSGVPMVVVYKVSPLSYLIGRALIRVKHISLVNLIAGKEIVPELIQGNASPENIADAVSGMLNHPEKLRKMRHELLGIRNLLGGPGASERVADIAEKMLSP
ncbi:lipid-A-disaccharide synthase [Desulfonema magnum]|uniref:Lipid-A-disaccharide synthase n=1 Tax=Desulfonema magnum TaxID=45655 RepID=A0A975BFP1_9BACT|nr:lipid-A-disaccharide synthase [Desulfonema magnum]QTA84220.1 Lipid-A-disaccharide synthase [Desulfonema magnum]